MEMDRMFENGPAGKLGAKILYVTNSVEIGRNISELRCRVTVVINVAKMTGIFRFFVEDDHELIDWKGKLL
jgi:hypothetical protein